MLPPAQKGLLAEVGGELPVAGDPPEIAVDLPLSLREERIEGLFR